MKIQLSLTEKWFRLTENFTKTEDYREITPYWCSRLLLYEDKKKSVKWWSSMQHIEGCSFGKAIESNIINGKITFRTFDENIMTLGYPKKTDTNKILRFEHKGIEIRTGIPEWGAKPNKRYFVIMHGILCNE